MAFLINKHRRHSPAPVIKAKGGKKALLNKLKSYLDTEEPRTVKWLVGVWDAQGANVSYKELREAYLNGGISQKQLDKWQKDYSNLVKTALAPQWQAAMGVGAEAQKSLYPHLLYEPGITAAQDYIKQHGAELVTALAQSQKDALQQMIAHASGYDAMTADELSRIMRPVIGLTAPQAKANLTYYNNIKKQLLKDHPRMTAESAEAKAKEAAAKYAAKQHRYRAFNIARTELASAYNQGAYGATQQARQDGNIGDCKKVWLTADDERVCAICGGIDGESVNMNDLFSIGVLIPPAHPNCRCGVAYEEIENTNLTSDDKSSIIESTEPQTQNDTNNNSTVTEPLTSPEPKVSTREAALAKPKHLRTPEDWRAIWDSDTTKWDKLTDDQRKEKLKSFEADWVSRLTRDEQNAVVKYTGSAYEDINDYARFGKVGGGYTKKELERLNGLLKSAFTKTQLDFDIRVARGVRGSYADKIRNMKIGDIDYDAAVRSTSYTRGAAFSGLTMDISIPAGSGRGSLVVSLSHFGDGEKEFIMSPGTKLRLIEYDKKKDRAYFELITDKKKPKAKPRVKKRWAIWQK